MEVSLITEDGFVDVNLPAKIVAIEDTKLRIRVEGEYRGVSIGFDVLVPENMEPGICIENDEMKIVNSYNNGLEIISIGTQSDEFFRIIAEAYGVEQKGKIAEKTRFTILPLSKDKFDLRKDVVRTKIFFDQKDEFYCEAFFNFALAQGFVGLYEKDPEYRENLLSVLSQA